ncbi:hypothetical protein [Pelagerythrobacter marensis]|nr:hypothetical protein [Pelagerythrobacter marensis]
MISQFLSNTQMSTAPVAAGTPPVLADDAAATGGFSGLLATLGAVASDISDGEGAAQVVADGADAADQPADPLALALAASTELPAIAGTGKDLPVAAAELPGGDADPALPARGAGTGAGEATAARTPGSALSSPENTSSPGTTPAQANARPAVAIEVAPRPSSPAGEAGGTNSVHQAATGALDASAGREAAQRDGGRNQGDPQSAARTIAEQAGAALAKSSSDQMTFAATTTAAAANGVAAGGGQGALAQNAAAIPAPGAPNVETSNPFSADKPAIETQVARELGRIVDSLASAREAFSAKAATLALDHAEFGEVSLRFDQRRDGQLAVQLSAADPDAHRAIAAAVAERPALAAGDNGSAGTNNQTGGGASARAGAERDGAGTDAGGPGRERRDGGRDAQRNAEGQPARSTPQGSGRAAVYA